MHFNRTYSSRLNQVKLGFAKIERDGTARGVFTSVPDLKRKLMRYIRKYANNAIQRFERPFHGLMHLRSGPSLASINCVNVLN